MPNIEPWQRQIVNKKLGIWRTMRNFYYFLRYLIDKENTPLIFLFFIAFSVLIIAVFIGLSAVLYILISAIVIGSGIALISLTVSSKWERFIEDPKWNKFLDKKDKQPYSNKAILKRLDQLEEKIDNLTKKHR